ncbi:MAG TPA: glycosyltransferase [Terriglobales bacterium]|nr:glycosyltransferase [Terriglobales bacterium]
MSHRLKLRFFAHSWVSDWNHGNAHFLRGLARELIRLGHEVRCYEQSGAWSVANLLREEGDGARAAIEEFWRAFPELDVRFYQTDAGFPNFAREELRGADVVIVHEWTAPEVVNTVAALKRELGFRVLFHDTHHRAYSNPKEVLRLPLREFDGVLAFGEAIRRIYCHAFGIQRAWTFHEAADLSNFHPIDADKTTDVIWVGNWGDEERSQELQQFLIEPAAALHGRRIAVHGVRYPQEGRRKLESAGIEFRGYLPNLRAPRAYAESAVTVHVPRRQYANGLSGVPTIRVFEALACGIPLLCAPWTDTENLFRPGEDYLCVPDGRAMAEQLHHFLSDPAARRQMAANGLRTIQQRHTCAHRAGQLQEICEELGK